MRKATGTLIGHKAPNIPRNLITEVEDLRLPGSCFNYADFMLHGDLILQGDVMALIC